ncbi:MAG: LacI family DNA-binding transcriptional regulator [Lachnospiraceae bacterium]|nr:LacI family DNA-binding transcriptional regulator [Lachnospiraceae bacterium]
MGEQRVRISDIAEELGLSTATVSNVIHGKTKKISDETVKRVQALLEERQYIPSMAGILLAQNSSKIIGVFINDHEKYEGHTLEDVFIASSLNYLSTEIEKQGQFMMVKKAKNPKEVIQFASMWNMDGLVVIGFCDEDYMYLRNHMRIPFVVYDGFCENPERIFNITIDNFDGGFQVGEYFRQLGHKNALCLSDNDVGIDKQRYDGFCAGFGTGTVNFMIIPMLKEERWEFYHREVEQFRKVSAIFVVSDYYAIDLIHFLNEQGIRVPEDISVAGFDDIPMCEMISPTLTTVKQDCALRAKIALQKLREMKENLISETEIMLPVTLVKRASTKEVKD